MATLKDIIKENFTYQCDSCKKTFKSKDIVFEDAADNITILTPPSPFVYVDKDGKIVGGSKQPSKEKGDKILCCPHCKMTHLFGLDRV